jgi:nucleoside-diphosphate-sugar epimerase
MEGDLLERDFLRKAMRGVEAVVHLAAVSRVQDAEEDPELAETTNVTGTQMLVEEAGLLEAPPLLVHASSREVYGEPTSLPVAEKAAVAPINTYGRTKAAAEPIALAYSQLSSQAVVVLRFSNVYGSIHDQPRRVIPMFATQALSGKPLEVHDGSKTFDFVHVQDAGRSILAALKWAEARRGAPEALMVNVATGKGTTLRELATMVLLAAGSKATAEEKPARDFDVRHFVGDPRLAKKMLGFACEVELKEGLRRTVGAFRWEMKKTAA